MTNTLQGGLFLRFEDVDRFDFDISVVGTWVMWDPYVSAWEQCKGGSGVLWCTLLF